MKLMKIAMKTGVVVVATLAMAGPGFAEGQVAQDAAKTQKVSKANVGGTSVSSGGNGITTKLLDPRTPRAVSVEWRSSLPGAKRFEDPYAQARLQENETLLRICKKYKHCDCLIADQLHCYQLESMLIKMNAGAEKEKLSTEAQFAKPVDLLGDLKMLNTFGTPSNSRYIAPFEGGSK